ncbi:MAG TPA: IclR family transcriptional regulator [Pseudonocardia sp.]|jgi:IclR family acetate operon transcriptional repressor|uniref:IclR family transcriptional regulator n=1 Tax=Pseudonocardia sp. TaxID=60912 RepID=UPI002ED9CEDE
MGSAGTVLRALEAVASAQPMGVSELARRLEISKPAAQRALLALAETGWIRRSEQQPGRWVLTVKVLDIANHLGGELGLRDLARPAMLELVRVTGEATHLSVLDGLDVVTIDEVESTEVVRIHWSIGTRGRAYATANGKALLANLPASQLSEHIPDPLEAFTENTITEVEKLHLELAEIRRRGYSVQHGELRSDVASISACICPVPDHPVASLSIFMPIQRYPADGGEQLGRLVADAAAKITAGLAGV